MLTPRYHIAAEYYRHNKSAVAKKADHVTVAEVPDVVVSKDEKKQPANAVVEIADDEGSSGDSSQCSSSSNSSET
jgi:hypothetical protein